MLTERRRRGPQRSETSRQAIIAAASTLFQKHGYDHLTIEAIAAEAHVGKQTIYRWWPSKAAIIAECLSEGLLLPDWFVPENTGDVRADLRTWLRNIVLFLSASGNETLLRSLVIAGAENADVAQVLNERLGVWQVIADRVGDDTIEVGEALVGAIVIRSLRGGALDEEFADRLIDAIAL